MIDHMTVTVKDLRASVAFYAAALKPLGYGVVMDFGEFVGFGDARKPYFFLRSGPTPTQPMHIAFSAPNRVKVQEFHDAAVKAGAKDDGRPGVRENYHPHYFGAFVIDPDGHPIEAVCHAPEKAQAKGKAKAAPKAKAKAKAKLKPGSKSKAKARRR